MPEDQPPGPEPHEQITPETIQEVEKQIEASYIKLMDDWEASVPDNGEFFIKVGRKLLPNDPASYVDTRALILREGKPTQSRLDRELNAVITGDESATGELDVPKFLRQRSLATPLSEKRYMVMTRKGPKTMTMFDDDFEKLSRLQPNEKEKGGFSEATRTIGWSESASHYTDLTNDDAGDKIFNEALTKSIEVSRESSRNAKEKAALDTAKQEQARSQRLSGLSDKAIKPTTSEGPATPPSSPT